MIAVEATFLISALHNPVPPAHLRRVTSSCLSGLQVLNGLLKVSMSVANAPFPVLIRVLGDTATTQPLITNAQALRVRARPRIQLVYELPFPSAILLMVLSFELCAFRYRPLPGGSWHPSNF